MTDYDFMNGIIDSWKRAINIGLYVDEKGEEENEEEETID